MTELGRFGITAKAGWLEAVENILVDLWRIMSKSSVAQKTIIIRSRDDE